MTEEFRRWVEPVITTAVDEGRDVSEEIVCAVFAEIEREAKEGIGNPWYFCEVFQRVKRRWGIGEPE